ncbi:virB8 family protein [Parablastomonas sp. CN1-191]|uniref:virB8 family protein n=1 Tax=Parablastomonas sp. CN1-191 TaxID=3400908 RepID=UPI003BF8DED3
MSDLGKDDVETYYRDAATWADDRTLAADRSQTLAWRIAAVAGIIALLEAIAIVLMVPLKRVEPYTLLVDRQTGAVQALSPLKEQTVAADTALTRSFLVQYVVARESFGIDSLQSEYRKVSLWSAGDARDSYTRLMQASNPNGPLSALPRRAIITTDIRSVSSLSPNTAMVRFTTTRTDPGAGAQPPQYWAAIITYRFSTAKMSEADRLVNPLGFQVLRYRRDIEALPEATGPQPVVVVPRPVKPQP